MNGEKICILYGAKIKKLKQKKSQKKRQKKTMP